MYLKFQILTINLLRDKFIKYKFDDIKIPLNYDYTFGDAVKLGHNENSVITHKVFGP